MQKVRTSIDCSLVKPCDYKCNVAEYAIHRTLSEPARAVKQRTAWVVVNARAGLS